MRIPGLWRTRQFFIKHEYFFRLDKYIHDKWILSKASSKVVEFGVNLIGFAKGDFGIAEHLRLVTHAVKTTKINFCVNDSHESAPHTLTNNELNAYISKNNPFKINLFCYNSVSIYSYMKSVKGKIALKKHYNIGYGYWELSKYPSKWTEYNKYLNEIWAPSKFIKEVIEAGTDVPVYYMPIPVDFPTPVGYSRKQFNIPEGSFMFLFTFDMRSYTSRKNPQSVIMAFTKAFPLDKNDSVSLVIKVNRIQDNEEHNLKVDLLRQQMAFDPRILIVDENLDRSSILGLISVCDSYISLHRAEGFGLGMAEAMKMGKLVIGTNYSGNTDFMNKDNSCLVSYELVEVGKEEYPLVEDGAMWADPNIEDAVAFMKKAYQDPIFTKKIGQAAKLYIDTYHNFKVIGENYEKRINEVNCL